MKLTDFNQFKPLTTDAVAHYTASRAGEQKLGDQQQRIADLSLAAMKEAGIEYVVLGIPEDIGPRANLGNPGATNGWPAFLAAFLNLQANSLIPWQHLAVLGAFDFSAQQATSHTPDCDITQLRNLCADIDEQVADVLQAIFDAQLTPIIIGGGHNNAYPIIKACSQSEAMPLAVCNLDPHSDFRAMEGRHSGNPFRYAQHEGFLKRYMVLGLHEQKNNQDALDAMALSGFPWISIQNSLWNKMVNFDQCLEDTAKYLMHSGLPVGIELDVDGISHMPASAITATGFPYEEALYYVAEMSRIPRIKYLHLAEAAPNHHNSQEMRMAGQILSELVCMFIKTDFEKRQEGN